MKRVNSNTIIKVAGQDYEYNEDLALSLKSSEVTDAMNPKSGKKYSKTHNDGWTISAVLLVDEYEWVNDFEAEHQGLGCVWGNFEDEVYADSEEAFRSFYKKHKPEVWNYEDI